MWAGSRSILKQSKSSNNNKSIIEVDWASGRAAREVYEKDNKITARLEKIDYFVEGE